MHKIVKEDETYVRSIKNAICTPEPKPDAAPFKVECYVIYQTLA